MGIMQKMKSAAKKMLKKTAKTVNDVVKDVTDSELSAEEVTREEVYPKKVKSKTRGAKPTDKTVRGKAPVKPTAKRGSTRPTNAGYKMIAPDDTADAGKS